MSTHKLNVNLDSEAKSLTVRPNIKFGKSGAGKIRLEFKDTKGITYRRDVGIKVVNEVPTIVDVGEEYTEQEIQKESKLTNVYITNEVTPVDETTYKFVYKVKSTNKVYALTTEDKLVMLDPDTYEKKDDISIQVGNITPVEFYADETFIYITSFDRNANGKNKVVLYKVEGLSNSSLAGQIGGGWGFNNVNGNIYHPIATTSDLDTIYINASKARVIRIWKKQTILDNWGKTVNPDAYINLPITASTDAAAVSSLAVHNNKLFVSYTGSPSIYKYDVSDIHSGSYATIDNEKTYEATEVLAGNIRPITRIKIIGDKALVQLQSIINLITVDDLHNFNFTNFIVSGPSNNMELSLIDFKQEGDNITIYTCVKGSTISVKPFTSYNLTKVKDLKKVTNVKSKDAIIYEGSIINESDTDVLVNSRSKFRLKQPITIVFTEDTIGLTSMFMEDLEDAKLAVKINGLNEELIVLDLSDTVITPFTDNIYKTKIFQEGGVYESVNGGHIRIPRLNVTDILDYRFVHNNRAYGIIENLKCDWTLGFNGNGTIGLNDGIRYKVVDRFSAMAYAHIFTNMAYAFSSQTMLDCLDHFSYMTRSLFISDVRSISDGTQVAWYHLDKNDPYYKEEDRTTFLNRVGVDGWDFTTQGKGSHWNVTIDTVQVGVASYGGAGGGGWVALSRGQLGEQPETVTVYSFCHEFGHSRGWQHGSSFAYGLFSDGKGTDSVQDLLPSISRTLLHMEALPYIKHFDKEKYDYLELDQIECKVYLSRNTGWWNKELLDHVNRKVARINQVADEYDNSLEEKKADLTAKMAELKAHCDEFIAKTGRPISDLKRSYEPWRDAVQKESRFDWLQEKMPNKNLKYWDRFNQTYGTGKPIETTRDEVLAYYSNKYNRQAKLNKWNFREDTSFILLNAGAKCGHEGHTYPKYS